MKKNLHSFVVLAYKESDKLEECIKSVLNQKYKSDVVIATSTPNDYIKKMAKKYNLYIVENDNHIDIGGDFDFAISCGKTNLVTVAHQDDIYDYEYSYEMVKNFENNPDALILFPDYYEIKNDKKIYSNTNLKIKRILLRPLKNQKKSYKQSRKRKVIKYGSAIGCPSVTFNTNKVKLPVFFGSGMKCNIDWFGWERLSKQEGKFVYINKFLMGHRISGDTTTTEIINQGIRTKEDLIMFKKFWPTPIAKLLNRFYKKAEKNNNVEE